MAYYFGVKDAKIAVWNADEDYGPTLVDLGAVSSFEVTINSTNARLEGDDVIADTHSKTIGATVNVQFGEISLAALALLSGDTVAGGDTIDFASTNRPYVMLCGKVDGTGDGGDVHVYIRKCKLETDLALLTASYGSYVQPRMQLAAIPEDSTGKLIMIKENASSTALTYDPDSL